MLGGVSGMVLGLRVGDGEGQGGDRGKGGGGVGGGVLITKTRQLARQEWRGDTDLQ